MELKTTRKKPLSLSQFKEMDTLAIHKFGLSIELMMENAGLQLARRVSANVSPKGRIVIGAGNGNNGGGGLVAARRLAGWGYDVFLDLPVEITKDLPQRQLHRALASGVKLRKTESPSIWVDAYLGFSQRLPLSQPFQNSIHIANESKAYRISLDLPTGLSPELDMNMFKAQEILTLAAYKQVLECVPDSIVIYLADIGIPLSLYTKFGLHQPDFHKNQSILL